MRFMKWVFVGYQLRKKNSDVVAQEKVIIMESWF